LDTSLCQWRVLGMAYENIFMIRNAFPMAD